MRQQEAFKEGAGCCLGAVYEGTLKQEGITELGDQDWSFMEDSLLAIEKLAGYASPWFVQLTGFEQREASGLQIARSPGQKIVYLGSAMLTVGVFLLFYVAHRRIWVWMKPLDDGQTEGGHGYGGITLA